MGAPEPDIIDQLAAMLAPGATFTPSPPKPIPAALGGPPGPPLTAEQRLELFGEEPPPDREPPLLASFRPPSIRRGR